MTQHDARDLPLSTTQPVAAAHYREGVDRMLSAWPGAAAVLEAAVQADPSFAMAHAARARLHAVSAEPALAKAAVAQAAQLLAGNGQATERERSHVHALGLAIDGQPAQALAAVLQHLDQWPRDVLIMAMPMGAFGLFAFSGMAEHNQARVDLCERHARHLAADDWWFLTQRGWAHGENGNLALGRELTHRALNLRRNNANAAHAAAHVLFEAGAMAEADALLSDWLPGYAPEGILHGHLLWHRALHALQHGDAAGALALYEAGIAPGVSKGVPLNVMSDAASLLWRLLAQGHAVPQALVNDACAYAQAFFAQAGFAFADVHMAMLAAASGDAPAVERRAAALDAHLSAGRLPAGPVVAAVCRALLAFAEGRYAPCALALESQAHEVVRLGGSGAQREVVEDTLLQALLRSGQAGKARLLLERRLQRRPSAQDHRWHAQLPVPHP